MSGDPLLFLVGLGVGWIGQSIWDAAMELIDIYRSER